MTGTSRTAIVAALSVITSAVLLAQQPAAPAPPSSSPAIVIKGRAPVSTSPLEVRLPRPAEVDLGNGLHLMVLEDRRVPQVNFQLVMLGAGGYFDPVDLPGLANVTAAMLTEGTTSRNTQQIAEALETMAATTSAVSGMSSAVATISGSSLTENFDATFAIAADVLLHPTFPSAELDRYRTRTKAALVQQRSQPGFLANEVFSRIAYGSHPASRPALTAAALDTITSERLAAFHKTRYVPDHAVLAIAGDLSMAEARKIVEPKLSTWRKAGTPRPSVSDPAPSGPARVSFVARPNSVQTTLWVGTDGISRTDPDYDVVTVMNAILGGGPTGRLFTVLREEKGYTYGASSNVTATLFRGTWLAATDVRTDVTEPALRDLMGEIARMRNEPVPTKEFDDRRRGMVASFALSLEQPATVLNNHVTRWIYGLPIDYWDRLPARTMAVTQAAVQAAARKYLDPSRLHIVAVGDPGKVADILRQFGTLDAYDTNGVRQRQ